MNDLRYQCLALVMATGSESDWKAVATVPRSNFQSANSIVAWRVADSRVCAEVQSKVPVLHAFGAAAWAVDERGAPLHPLIPGGPRQREMALRGGVNLVRYALTGNYKADQVHMPALLERLGRQP